MDVNRTLLISAKQIKLSSVLDLNVDDKTLHASIFDVQNIELKATLQEDLYKYILLQVYTNKTTGHALPDDIKGLLDEYITPFLINAVLVDFSFKNQYKLSNAGTEKLVGSGYNNVTPSELEFCLSQYRSKKASYKKLLIAELKRRKLLSKNADINSDENFGVFIPFQHSPGQSTLEEEGVIINDVTGVGFEPDTGELFLITASANYLSTNLDGRYRLSKLVTDVVNNGVATLLQFDPARSKGCFIDYSMTEDDNQRTGRIIANWLPDGRVTFSDYASQPIGSLPVTFAFASIQDRITFNITAEVNNVAISLMVTEI